MVEILLMALAIYQVGLEGSVKDGSMSAQQAKAFWDDVWSQIDGIMKERGDVTAAMAVLRDAIKLASHISEEHAKLRAKVNVWSEERAQA
jgi:polyhydroxyalkanoate synthesis regulator phasin